MSKEYIERGALLNDIEEIRPLNWTDTEAEITEQADFDWFENLVKSQPVSEVQKIKYGKWIISSDGYYPYCSECGKEPKEMSDFCPHCGAKMDKE